MKKKKLNKKSNIYTKRADEYPCGFTLIDNRIINNIYDLSPDTEILYIHQRSKSEGWYYNKKEALKTTKLTSKRYAKAIKELEEKNLLICKKVHNRGRYEYYYVIFEVPYKSEEQDSLNEEIENNILNSTSDNEDTENDINIKNNDKKELIKINLHSTKEYTQIKDLNLSKSKQSNKLTKGVSRKKVQHDELMKLVDRDFPDSKVNNMMKLFINDQTEKKKPVTSYRYKILVESLKKISENSDEQVQIIINSIESCWSKFCPLKNKTVDTKPTKKNTLRKNRENK